MTSKKITAHLLENSEKLDIITEAFQKYMPRLWNSTNYRFDMISAVLDNKEYLNDFVDYIQYMESCINHCDTDDLALKNGQLFDTIAQTLMHDVGGLMKKDEHFLPRVCTSGRYNINVI